MEFFAEGSDLYLGAGTVVTTPGAWTSVGCIISVQPNTITQSFRDVRPCLNSAAPRKVKKKPTTIDYGSFGVTFRFAAAKYEAIKMKLEAQTTVPVATVLGDTTKANQATCYIESLGIPSLDEDGEVVITANFLIDDDFSQVEASTIVGGD